MAIDLKIKIEPVLKLALWKRVAILVGINVLIATCFIRVFRIPHC